MRWGLSGTRPGASQSLAVQSNHLAACQVARTGERVGPQARVQGLGVETGEQLAQVRLPPGLVSGRTRPTPSLPDP
jgi:hypothetical protein